MIGQLFRSQKRRRPERPTFRPMLESLESREVPSSANVSAAFDSLPTDMGNLEASLAARPVDVNAVAVNLAAVANDLITMQLGAAAFAVPSRLQIDNALLVNGIKLVFDGFNTYPAIPSSQFVQIERLGFNAAINGFTDSLETGFFPQTTGDAVLT
jgi:hypothetical protein